MRAFKLRRRAALAPALIALLLCACAPKAFVLLPAPPVEVRRESPAPPPPAARPAAPPAAAAAADNAVKPPPPPPPPSHDPARYLEAIARTKDSIARGAPRAALPYWKTLEGGPWSADAIFNQGVLLQLAGDLDGARRQYRLVTDNVPVHEAAAANLLGLYQLRGDASAARALVSRVLPGGAAPPPSMLPQLKANLAGWFLETRELGRAASLLADLRSRGESAPVVAWNSAILSYRKGDPEGARREAALVPKEMGSLWSVAASRFAWEREKGEIPRLDNVPETEPVMAALSRNLAAFSDWSGGNVAGAEAALARAAAREDCPAELITNLGVARAEQGKWKEARAALEKAVRARPEAPEGWLNLGLFREIYEGDAAGAVECYRNYVKNNGLRKGEVAKWIEWAEKSQPQP